jgi:hypothetical protein
MPYHRKEKEVVRPPMRRAYNQRGAERAATARSRSTRGHRREEGDSRVVDMEKSVQVPAWRRSAHGCRRGTQARAATNEMKQSEQQIASRMSMHTVCSVGEGEKGKIHFLLFYFS